MAQSCASGWTSDGNGFWRHYWHAGCGSHGWNEAASATQPSGAHCCEVATYTGHATGISYRIVSGDRGADRNFDLDPYSGQLKLSATGNLNYEARRHWRLKVAARDGAGLEDTATVLVSVNNVNEAPVLQAQTRLVAENSPGGTKVGRRLQWSDPDGRRKQNHVFSIIAGDEVRGEGRGRRRLCVCVCVCCCVLLCVSCCVPCGRVFA